MNIYKITKWIESIYEPKSTKQKIMNVLLHLGVLVGAVLIGYVLVKVQT